MSINEPKIIDVTVRRTATVEFYCPYCEEEISCDEHMIASEEWATIDMDCHHCNKHIETDSIDWNWNEEDGVEFKLLEEEEDNAI